MAKLYYFYGAMNSGKTTRVIQCAHNYEEQGMKVILMKPKIDGKGEDKITARAGLERKVDYLIDDVDNLYYLIKAFKQKYRNLRLILIDEAEFLSRDQVNQLMDVVIDMKVPIMCYGIRTDFLTNGFPGGTRLLEIAHHLEEVKTICKCGAKAMQNIRKVDGVVVTEGESVAIELGNTTYETACPKCYVKRTGLKFYRR